MDATALRDMIPREEFDHQVLLGGLKSYAFPRDKITSLLRTGVIVRVKKGLYVFGDRHRRGLIVRELLANLAYGPSYVSMETALAWHGMIPEAVHAVTSVTTGRSRRFHTPLGLFTYRQISVAAFRVGMDRVPLEDGRSFLMATQEKALADKVIADRGTGIRTRGAMEAYLLEDLRIDPAALATLDPARLRDAADAYRSHKLALVASVAERM